MIEQHKKVIIVSNKTNEKISDELRASLIAQGIEVVIKNKESMTIKEAVELGLVHVLYEVPVSEVFDSMLREDAEKIEYDKKQNKYVPKKIGNESKAKIKHVRGKRYGR